MTDDLSRLLDGELDPAEAEALRARIARDPVLAARWERMQALPRRIRALPRELPVPAPRAVPTPRRRWWAWGAGVAALAAVAMLAVRPEPTRVLVEGTEVVVGHASVAAGDVRVDVDGAARITVEPPGGGSREVATEIDPMNVSHLAAAVAGSVVTVTVLQGSAWLHAHDAPPTEVHAGETRTVAKDEPRSARAEPRPTHRPAPDPAARIADLERQVARLEQEKAAASGTVRRLGGAPQPWPQSPAAALRPDAFQRLVRERAAAIPDVEVARIDCAEYPCVAVVESLSDAPDWEVPLAALHDDIEGLENAHVLALAGETETPEGNLRLYAFAVAPPEISEEGMARLKARAQDALHAEGGE